MAEVITNEEQKRLLKYSDDLYTILNDVAIKYLEDNVKNDNREYGILSTAMIDANLRNIRRYMVASFDSLEDKRDLESNLKEFKRMVNMMIEDVESTVNDKHV